MENPTMVTEPSSYDLVNKRVTRRKVCFGMHAEYYDILNDRRLLATLGLSHSTPVHLSVYVKSVLGWKRCTHKDITSQGTTRLVTLLHLKACRNTSAPSVLFVLYHKDSSICRIALTASSVDTT